MKNKRLASVNKIINWEEVYCFLLATDKNGKSISERDQVVVLIHNRKDIKVGDTISVENHFGELYDYEVLEVVNNELVVWEI